MLTAYDYPTALAMEQAGVDSILVGDSLGMVVLGYENTLPVTMADMLHHCKAVARGAHTPLLVGDMPFMSYQAGWQAAVSATPGAFYRKPVWTPSSWRAAGSAPGPSKRSWPPASRWSATWG